MWSCTVLSVSLYASMSRFWTDASISQLEAIEAIMLREYGQVCGFLFARCELVETLDCFHFCRS